MTSGIEEKGSTKVERVEITLLPKWYQSLLFLASVVAAMLLLWLEAI